MAFQICRFPPSPKQLLSTAACFASGLALFVWGAQMSYLNVTPQQARIKARSDLLREHLRRKYGYVDGKYIYDDGPSKVRRKQ